VKTPFGENGGWRTNSRKRERYFFDGPNGQVIVDIGENTYNGIFVSVNDGTPIFFDLDGENTSATNEEALTSFKSWASSLQEDHVSIFRKSEIYMVPLISFAGTTKASADTLTAPMPGKIIALNCAAGDAVSEGDALVVMEAMKMEQTLTAPRDGVVAEVGVAVGDLVTDGALLVRLEEVES
jgi:3-methylcrotonyl-CoA carboxylase alpha subunit